MRRSRFGRRSVAWGAALALVAFVLLGTWHHHEPIDPGGNGCQVCKLTTVGAILPGIGTSAAAPAPESGFLANETTAARGIGHDDPFSARAPPVPANA